MKARLLVFLALCVVQVIQSCNAIGTRYAVTHGFEPSLFLAFRIIISLPPLFLVASWQMKRQEKEAKAAAQATTSLLAPASSFAPSEGVPKSRWWPSKNTRSLILLGNLGICLNFLLWIYGMQLTSASVTGIAGASTPVFTAMIAMVTRKEAPSFMKIFGILVAFSGALITLDPNRLAFDLGITLLLTSNFFYSVFLVLQRPLLDIFPPAYVVSRCFLYGGVGVYVAAAINYRSIPLLPEAEPLTWGACCYAALCNTVIAYILNGYAIRHGSPVLAALFTNSQPILIIFLATTVLGEIVTKWQIIGAGLIIVGVIIVTIARMRDDKFVILKEEALRNKPDSALLPKDIETEGGKESIDLTYGKLENEENEPKRTDGEKDGA